MTGRKSIRRLAAVLFAVLLVVGIAVVVPRSKLESRTQLTAFFETSTGIYPGDDVRILGVPVGKITAIQPQPQRAKVTFWVDDAYQVPADARAVILSPSLVSARALELTPAYTGGPVMANHTVIPLQRTAVPVEWDDLRTQLDKLSTTLQPTEDGGVSTLGAFVNTMAANLRGQGGSIRNTVIQLSQTLSALGDHSADFFGTVRNLSLLVSALHGSTDAMTQLNVSLAAVTALLANDPNEVGQAVADLNGAVRDVKTFVDDNRESVGTAGDKLSDITQALVDNLDDVKQLLHIAPNTLANSQNMYSPAHAALTGALALNNFSNPVSFVCGAIQAASRLGAEQASKLCVQYLAPIMKNRQYNFPPLGFAGMPLLPFLPVGATARPNELTYSEDWLRPDFVPPVTDTAPLAAESAMAAPLPTESQPPLPPPALPTDPAAGLPGLMVPPTPGSGS